MEAFPPKFSNVLVTPDPQYIPGYAGYCPQLKFSLGETYGKLTARLLTSPEVSRSRRLLLYNSNAAPSGQKENAETDLPEETLGGLPEFRRHPARMLPGYTGFIPKSRNCFFRTYTETCREALTDFQKDLQKRKRLTASAELPRINNGTAPKPTLGCYSTPLTPIAKESAPYKSPTPWKHPGSPYTMDERDPNKYFISGFTGYIPKSRFLFGTGFPIIANRALIQFDKEARGKNGVLQPTSEELPPITTIYPSQSGLVPSYTGHVPGYRFTFGQTYGQLTHDALGSSGTLKGR
ncbi:hypothetical protein COCON_G00165970 [Conger conger]|uniref:Ciliary microtubule inner protein 2B n=1 Tax=Conger conger TaxID=82655 RepID=A0A9Q1D7K2_CONCO|nr:ciliary microtubule inner protein 2B [Conger conger]KAJ8260874.1 hypothetical protein COCON_G00165970 [Conger conger]